VIVAMRVRFGLVFAARVLALAILIVPSLTSASVPSPPQTFVVVTEQGLRSQMSIYSSDTGTIVRPLASFADDTFTNNGLAYAPDGTATSH
jgi:hypothetical protein